MDPYTNAVAAEYALRLKLARQPDVCAECKCGPAGTHQHWCSHTDTTFALRDGHYCRVSGKVYGPWRSAPEARAGLQVQQRRALAQRNKAPAQP